MSLAGVARSVAFPVILFELCSSLSYAARLPDWAQAIADTAPAVPEGVPSHPSRVLLSEVHCTVASDGTLRIRKRLAEQILSAAAPEYDFGRFWFDGTAKMTATRAWHVAPGDNAKRSWMSPADLGVGDVFLSEMKIRTKAVPGIRKGSLVFFEFEATDKPWFLMLRNQFFEGVPLVMGRFELETPPGWTVAWEWLTPPGPEPVQSGDTRVWEVREPALTEDEPLAPSASDQAPSLIINAVPPHGVITLVPTFKDWSDFSIWYENLIAGRHTATPLIRSTAGRITSEAGTDFFAKVAAAGKFVRDGVRYVAVELGIAGFQPKPADETLSGLLGDCKDKTTLFRALLAALEIPSYAILVNLSRENTVMERLPVYGFNHLIAAVHVPDGIEIPSSFSPAIMDAGDMGQLLIVDTTDEKTSIGSLSAALAGKKGLLVDGPRGRLITLPDPGSATHRVERQLVFAFKSDRSVDLERLSTYRGQFASNARARYSSSSADRRKAVEHRVLELWPDATLTDYSAEPERADGAFVEKISARFKPLPATGTDSTIRLFPGALDDVPRVPLGKRKLPVIYPHPMSIHYEMTLTGTPDTVELPHAQEINGDGWSARTTFQREESVVKATWEVSLTRTRFTIEQFVELRKFWSAVTSSAGSSVSLNQ